MAKGGPRGGIREGKLKAAVATENQGIEKERDQDVQEVQKKKDNTIRGK